MPTATSERVLLGLNFNHDGAAALLVDGELRGYANTERFSRRKKHPGVRQAEIDEVCAQAGVGLEDIEHVLICNLNNMDSPDVEALHDSDLKATWAELWVRAQQDEVLLGGRAIPCTVNPDHHTLHAAAAFYTSPFESAAVLVVDPLGARGFIGRGSRLQPVRAELAPGHRAHIGYCYVAKHLFGSAIVGAGKVMGLAPYGRPERPADVQPEAIRSFRELMQLGSQDPVVVREQGRELNATLAWYVQHGLELQMEALFEELHSICRGLGVPPAICLGGGTALNAVATELAFERSGFEAIHFHPACGDDGTAIGAALWHWHERLGHPRRHWSRRELMYSRRTYGRSGRDHALAGRVATVQVEPVESAPDRAAELVAAGAIVGWFDGASEVGPRALGHRSIIADPRDPTIKDRVNQRVKFRESFRPFAPSVLREHAGEWFDIDDSPFMLRCARVLRAGVPAVTHIDETARIQTVDREDDPGWHRLISAFARRTGVPLVLNTSLNVKGQPIAETYDDALEVLVSSGLDALVLPGVVVTRTGESAAVPTARAAPDEGLVR
jgi:carbamoyltransferase